MSVHLKIEESREGVIATLSQRDDEGKVIGDPSVGLVASAAEARQLAKTLALSLGLKVYRVIDKTKSAGLT
jgi:phosphatidylglycerophosphatase A